MTDCSAHITFPEGGLVVPVGTPYDRQLLRECILAGVHHQPRLQVSVDGAHWRVEPPDQRHPTVCSHCSRGINHAVCRVSDGATAYCVACALHA